MYDVSIYDLMLDNIPEIKMNSGRKTKQINNRYFSFFQRLDKKHIPPIIDDLIRGACTATMPGKEDNNRANQYINSYIVKSCMMDLTTFSASSLQALKCCNELSYSYIMNIIIGLEGVMKRMDHHFDLILKAIPESNIKWMDEFNCYVDLDTGEMGSSNKHCNYMDDNFDTNLDSKNYKSYEHKDQSPLEYLDSLKLSGLTDDEIINHLQGVMNNPELWSKEIIFKHVPYISVESEKHQCMINGQPFRNYRKEHYKPEVKYSHGLEGKNNIKYLPLYI